MSSKSVFDEVYGSKNIFDQVYGASPKNKPKAQEPATLKGSAVAYGSGFGGGVGGTVPDIVNLIQPFAKLNPAISDVKQLSELAGLKGTPELTASLAQQEPQNALERILQSSGQFGGQEALIGTALGGPAGAGLGAAHGSASGALYGGLKEAGVPDEWALGLTAVATLSPIAAQKLWPKLVNKFKSGSSFQSAAKSVFPKGIELGGEPPPPPPGPPPPQGPPNAKFGPGTVVPEAKGAFQEKEAILKQLEKPPEAKHLPFRPQFADVTKESPSFQGRTSQSKELGEILTKEPFATEAQAGRNLARDVTKVRDAEKEIVREKYKKAEEITSTHYDIFPNLAKQNEDRIARLESLEKRSAGEEAVYQDALTLRKMIGDQNGFIEANADRLMKQANSFSQKVKYELPYAGYKGEIKSIVHEINQSVIGSLEKAGKNASAVKDADKTFARFADRFMGDEISPFFHRKILNPESLAKKAISDEGTYRAVKNAIGSRKSPIVGKLDREVVHSSMDKYYKDPANVNSKEYVRDLKNLSEKIGKEKTAEVDHFLRQRQLSHEKKAFLENKIKEAQIQKGRKTKPIQPREAIAKTPEQLDKLFKSRSDIRRLRKEMKDKGLEKEFEKLSEFKVEEILREGGFGSKKVTGNDLKRIIDKEHEVLSELLGEEEVSLLYKAAAKAGQEELTEQIIKQVAKSAGKFVLQMVGLGKIIKLIPLNRI